MNHVIKKKKSSKWVVTRGKCLIIIYNHNKCKKTIHISKKQSCLGSIFDK